MASAKKKEVEFRGMKLRPKKIKKGERDPAKRYMKKADKRPHSERFNFTLEKLNVIAERMKQDLAHRYVEPQPDGDSGDE